MSGHNYEDTLSIEQLRIEVRHCWNKESALASAIQTIPDMADIDALSALVDAAYGVRWADLRAVGNAAQRAYGMSMVPPKAEYEWAAGLWSIIRDGLRKAAEQAQNKNGTCEPDGKPPQTASEAEGGNCSG